MSTETIKLIIARAVTEPEFQQLLFSDSAKALEGYELTADELLSLQGLSRQEFEALAGNLDERISRAGLHGRPNLSDTSCQLCTI